VLAPAAAAQGATPPVDLVAPAPAGCQVEPRTLDALAAFLATPAAEAATPDINTGTPVSFVAPAGEPADPATVAGVTATATALFACYNANDYLRVFALFTDEYLARSFVDEGMTEEALGFFGMPPEARPADAWESIAVRDVRVLVDGRVGAFLVGHNPEGDGVDFVDYTVFVERDGRYLIDDVVFLGGDAA